MVSAGTGLGQAFLVPEKNGKYTIMDSEGGHCDYAPRNELESEFLFFLQKTYSRGSIERVLSGPGLLDIYKFFITKHAENPRLLISPLKSLREPLQKLARFVRKRWSYLFLCMEHWQEI